jgi:5,10-methylenetetrahydrofolate reductase
MTNLKTFRKALHSQAFTVTAEMGISPQMHADEIIEQAKVLSAWTDVVQVPDHQHLRPHISNLVIAAHLLKNDIDPIVHMNCRDRNRIAIQSDLLGAHSLGVSGLLLMRGRRLPADHRPETTGVYDINAIELINSAAAIREGDVLAGKNLPGEPDFFIGTVARVLREVDDWQPKNLLSKVDAGAQFIQLRICMNPKSLQNYMSRLVSLKLTWRCRMLASLAVFSSADEARALRKSNSDVMVPRDVIQRLKKSKDPEQEGIRICAEQLQQLAEIPGIAGATVMAPGDPANIAAAIEASGVYRTP